MTEQLAPGFLIALPHLRDDNFRHAVVLLLQQDDEGAMGVVVNQESSMLLKDLCQDHSLPYSGDGDKLVRRGGPVQPEQGLVLYGPEHDDPDGETVVDGLHVSTARETLGRLCSLSRGRFHCYSGYAGWGPGQLEREIGDGTWLISDADPQLVLESPPGDMWNRSVRAMGIDPASFVSGGAGEA